MFSYHTSLSRAHSYRNNAAIYGVQDRLEYIVSDAYSLLDNYSSLQGMSVSGNKTNKINKTIDCVLLAPPWGGSEYIRVKNYDLHTMVTSGDFYDLIRRTAEVSKNIICILPRNTQKFQLDEICNSILSSGVCRRGRVCAI